MADFYCDISAIGNEYQAYADTPTWGALTTDKPLPQDGNGKAGPGHTAAVAIGTIDCTAASASGAAVLGLFGATISSTLTGSGSTLATNIVAAINACTAATTSTYSALLLPIKYFVFARVDPADANIVQIAHRIAGVDWNGMVCTTAGTWGTAPTMGAFAGGADGPLAYVYNVASVFGKAVTTGPSYGCWFVTSAAVTAHGTNDTVYIRSMRSAANLHAGYFESTASIAANWITSNFVVDNGTIWAGDDGILGVSFFITGTNATITTGFYATNTAPISLVAMRKYGCEFTFGGTTTAAVNTFTLFSTPNAASGRCRANHINFKTDVRSSVNFRMKMIYLYGYGASSWNIDLRNNLIEVPYVLYGVIWFDGIATNTNTLLSGLEFLVSTAAGAIGAPIVVASSAATGIISWVGGGISDSLGVYSCSNPVSGGGAWGYHTYLYGVYGISDPSISFNPGAAPSASLSWTAYEGAFVGYRYADPTISIDWKNNASFPYDAAAVNLKNQPWALRVTWPSISRTGVAVRGPKLARFYRGTEQALTVAVDLYVADAMAIQYRDIPVNFSYTSSDGAQRVETSLLTPVALPASTATWVANGVLNYSPVKVAFTTLYAVKNESEIMVEVFFARQYTGAVYVSPEVKIA